MYKISILFLCSLLLLTSQSLFAQAFPQDMSVAAHEKEKDAAKKRAIARVDRELAAEQAEIETLAEPFRVGEIIVLRRKKPGQPPVRGTYYSITWPSKEATAAGQVPTVNIADRHILMSDIYDLDQQRLILGEKTPAELKKALAEKRAAFETKRDSFIDQYTNTFLEGAGYSEFFKKSTLVFSGYYWKTEDLGNGRGRIAVVPEAEKEDPFSELYTVTLWNPVNTPAMAVVLLNGQPVASSYSAEGDVVLADRDWKGFKFTVLSSEVPDPMKLGDVLTVKYFKPAIGTWSVHPDMNQASTKMSGAPNLVVLAPFALVKKSLKPADDTLSKEFADLVTKSRDYAKKIDAHKVEAQKRLEQLGDEMERIRKIKEAKEKAEREQQERLAAIRERLNDELATWFTGDKLHTEKELSALDASKTNPADVDLIFGDYNFPVRISEQPVRRVSGWNQTRDVQINGDPSRKLRVVGLAYRYIEIATEPDENPIFLLQYRAYIRNGGNNALQLKPLVSISWADDTYQLSVNHTFRINQQWDGNLIGTIPIDVDHVMTRPNTMIFKPFPTDDAVKAALEASAATKAVEPAAPAEEAPAPEAPATAPTEDTGAAPMPEAAVEAPTAPAGDGG